MEKIKSHDPNWDLNCYDLAVIEIKRRIDYSSKEDYSFSTNLPVLKWTDEIYLSIDNKLKSLSSWISCTKNAFGWTFWCINFLENTNKIVDFTRTFRII